MNNHIAQTDKFNSETIDHDIIVPNKTYFNVYNNSLDEPFHKFWFFIENAKLTNIYSENCIFRFALNTKSDKNKKLIEYLKNLFEYIKNLFIKTYPEIVVDFPWKESNNYPCSINFVANNNTLYLDSLQNSKNMTEINKDQVYSILFELTYIQVVKIICGDKTNYSLKFKFNLIMIQEKAFDKKSCLLENINQMNNPKPKNIYDSSHPNSNTLMTNVLGELTRTDNKPLKNTSVPTTQPMMRLAFNANELLNKKMTLNKIGVKEKESKELDDDKNIPEYLEQKNKLKKVETDERSLITILKKEYEEIALHNNELNNTKNIKDEKSNKNTELTNNLLNTEKKTVNPIQNKINGLDELDELDELNELNELNELDGLNELNVLDELDELDELDKLNLPNKNLTYKNIPQINKDVKKDLIIKNNTSLNTELEMNSVKKSKNITKTENVSNADNMKVKKIPTKNVEIKKDQKFRKMNNLDLDLDLDLEFENISKN